MHTRTRVASPFLTTIGAVVVVIILAVVIYFAWIGWNERGRPVPDVDVKKEQTAPANP